MRSILLFGGYGGFGARLARRLSADGFPLLIAGRNAAKAEAFAGQLAGARGIAADRSGDVTALLRAEQPSIVIDAAGPFQGSDLRLAEQAIRSGAHFLDLADDRQFVTSIGTLDALAREQQVVALSGASSVPALSGAVVRHLAERLDQVSVIDLAISASSKAAAGPSVSAAILSGAGKPFTGWNGGRAQRVFGWSGLRKQAFDLPKGRTLGKRLVAQTEVPDLALLPIAYPGVSQVRFAAGTESWLATAGLALLALPVRAGLLRSLRGLSPLLGRAQRLTALWGGDQSGMVVRLVGRRDTAVVERCWTLVAGSDHGPEIPVLAAQLLIRKLSRGGLTAGARSADRALALSDFEPLFAELDIVHAVTERVLPPPLYRRVLGLDFDRLAPELRGMHSPAGQSFATGRARVTRGGGVIARLAAMFVGMPSAGEYDLHVTMDVTAHGERWTREFGSQRFHSDLSKADGRLVERFGALRFHFDLPVDAGGLQMVLRRWSIAGLALPRILAPDVAAREWAEDGRFHLDVSVSLPIVGLVVRYEGWLTPPTDAST